MMLTAPQPATARPAAVSRAAPPAPSPELKAMWQALLGEPTLSVAELAALDDMALERQWPAGVDVFSHQECAQGLMLLREGSVALGFRTAEGEFRSERHVDGPCWLDQASAWLGAPHAMDARTRTAARVVELPQARLQELVHRHAVLAERLIRSLAREVQALAVNTHELMHKDAPARLAAWMLQQSQPVPDAPNRALLHLQCKKRDIAAQLAITPETLSRLMRSFTRQGVIEVAGYEVDVRDVAGLKALAQ